VRSLVPDSQKYIHGVCNTMNESSRQLMQMYSLNTIAENSHYADVLSQQMKLKAFAGRP
jgi:hypothetical protein